MKFELEKIDQYIDIALAYSVETNRSSDEYYIITKEILEQYNIESKTFISYLCGDIKRNHNNYESCNQLWAQNRPLYKNKVNFHKSNSLENIKTVFTKDGKINLGKPKT